jgi:hypothetical protein
MDCLKLPAGQIITLKNVGYYHLGNMEAQGIVPDGILIFARTSVQVVLMGSLFSSD